MAEAAASAWPERAALHGLGSRSFPACLGLSPADMCIIASPCFSGRAAERSASLRGNGARALVISVCGRRAFGDSLLGITDLAARAGFQVVGAAAVCAQHPLASRAAAGGWTRHSGGDLSVLKQTGHDRAASSQASSHTAGLHGEV